MLSANDRSRWGTVRALVDQGTFAIDQVIYRPDGRRDPEWHTIDRVRHVGKDGREHDYSSKPPLLATLIALQYGMLKVITGISIGKQPFYVMRLLLILNHLIPLILFWIYLGRWLERFQATVTARAWVMAAATWGTFLTTFGVTLNNHIPGAVSSFGALYVAWLIGVERQRQWLHFVAAGLFAAFAVTCELPALSLAALLAAGLLLVEPRRTLLGFVPAALLVAAAFWGTNYVAHGSWRPPYGHRSDGPIVATLPAASVSLPSHATNPSPVNRTRPENNSATTDPISPLATPRQAAQPSGASSEPRTAPVEAGVRNLLAEQAIRLSELTTIQPATEANRWVLWDPQTSLRLAVLRQGDQLVFRQWDNWYEYEGTYWTPARKQGVDRGEPSRWVYAFHVLVGHRGIFSLTPLWCLSLYGFVDWLRRGTAAERGLAATIGIVTGVCLVFFLLRPLEDRNYGGVCCGFRWLFWLIPAWLLGLLPAFERCLESRLGRLVAGSALVISVASATYAGLNPWSQSWLYHYWTSLGWLNY
jgi:hypothetical protein